MALSIKGSARTRAHFSFPEHCHYRQSAILFAELSCQLKSSCASEGIRQSRYRKATLANWRADPVLSSNC